MLARLPKTTSERTIAAIARTPEVADQFLACSKRVLSIEGSTVRFLPGTESFELQGCENREKLDALLDYDVVEVDGDGFLRTLYRNSTPDNAIVPTGRCNSNCVMCPSSDYSRRTAQTESLEFLLEVASYFPDDAPHITITGGEPFLMGKDIFKLLEYMRSRFERTDFLMLTNGRALSIRSYREELERVMPAEMQLGIPLHGSTAETHDAITRAPGSFDQTVTGIEGLLARGIKVELRIVVSKLNMHDIDAIAGLVASRMGAVDSVKIIGLEMLGNAWKNRELVWIPYGDAFRSCEKAVITLMRANVDVRLYNFPLCAVPKRFWHICSKSITDYKVRFPAECEGCQVADACCGLFAGSYRHARSHINPIKES